MQARVNALRVELVIAGINQTQTKLENTQENLVDREAKADALKGNLEEKLVRNPLPSGKQVCVGGAFGDQPRGLNTDPPTFALCRPLSKVKTARRRRLCVRLKR